MLGIMSRNITLDKIRTTILIMDDGDMLKQKIFNTMCLLNEADIQRLCKKNSICEERDGCLYDAYRRLYIPDSNILRMEIIQKHHDSPVAGHPGYEKTIELLQCNYWWPGMATLVKEYIARCDTCQRFKGSNQAPAGLLQPLPIPNTLWKHISADFIMDLPLSHGYDSILTVVDRLYENMFSPGHSIVVLGKRMEASWRSTFHYIGPRPAIRGTSYAGA